jgi:hypothetical protein
MTSRPVEILRVDVMADAQKPGIRPTLSSRAGKSVSPSRGIHVLVKESLRETRRHARSPGISPKASTFRPGVGHDAVRQKLNAPRYGHLSAPGSRTDTRNTFPGPTFGHPRAGRVSRRCRERPVTVRPRRNPRGLSAAIGRRALGHASGTLIFGGSPPFHPASTPILPKRAVRVFRTEQVLRSTISAVVQSSVSRN